MNPLWNRQCIYTLSWDRFETFIGSILNQVQSAGLQPDIVVGIAKGGLIPSVRLFHLLKAQHYGVISIKRNTNSQYFYPRTTPQISWTQIPPSNFACALLVDDIVGSGETLDRARDTLSKHDSGIIKTASVVVNKNGRYRPDFFGCEIDDWVLFPWEAPAQFHEQAPHDRLPFISL